MQGLPPDRRECEECNRTHPQRHHRPQGGQRRRLSYSHANKDSGITWDEATFREYIKDPKAKVPGTKMIYPGLKDEQKSSDLVAFLNQFDADGKKK
jgi:cytochrome c2